MLEVSYTAQIMPGFYHPARLPVLLEPRRPRRRSGRSDKAVPNAAVLRPAHDDQLLSLPAALASLAAAARGALGVCAHERHAPHPHCRADGQRQVGLALRLAEQLGGVVINADSMQVYRELRILTARPTRRGRGARPARALWLRAGARGLFGRPLCGAMPRARSQTRAREGRRPIIVGGTGLYFKALLEGLSPMPADRRRRARALARRGGRAAAPRRLARRSSRRAIRRWRERLAPGDTQRIVRALEVLEATGTSLAEWQRLPREPVLDLAETQSARRCAGARRSFTGASTRASSAMMQQGALEEAAQLAALELDPSLPVMRALGVRPLLRHLAGEVTREEAVAAGQGRDPAIRQAAGDVGDEQYDCVEVALSTQEIESYVAEFYCFY